MGFFDTTIDSCVFEVRRGGMFGKKYEVSLLVYEKKIVGEAFDLYESDLHHTRYDLPYEHICGVYVAVVEGKESVVVEYKYKTAALGYPYSKKKLAFWGISDPEKWANLIAKTREKRMAYLHEQSEKEQNDKGEKMRLSNMKRMLNSIT